MPPFAVAQALFRREHEQSPQLIARSPHFADEWLVEAERLIRGFGVRRPGLACPLAVFAQPMTGRLVAIVQVADLEPGATGWPAMAFRFFVVPKRDYESLLADPFVFADQHPFDRSLLSQNPLPTIDMTVDHPPYRTIAQVQAVLRRVKANALQEGEDPEKVERTIDNSESPALLGGVQILVDSGKLHFERTSPDNGLIRALWTLLPDPFRSHIWPATFAFSNALNFDVVVGSGFQSEEIADYRTEDQAADYPPGSYELALQSAAEHGNQQELDGVFQRRSSGETLKLARNLLIGMILIVLAFKFISPPPSVPETERQRRAMAATSIIGVRDPLQMVPMFIEGNRQFLRR
ncbi:MAG: hypothetical protein U0744_12750 [Gemmataceae bacterium]